MAQRTKHNIIMKLRTPRLGVTGSSPGSSTSSSSRSTAAAASHLNHLINNNLTAAINDAAGADDESPEEPDDALGDAGDVNNNNANNADGNYTYNEDEEVNGFLQLIRDEMTVEGIEKNTRAKSTFNTHQNENTRVIVWLFYNHKHVIHDELCSSTS